MYQGISTPPELVHLRIAASTVDRICSASGGALYITQMRVYSGGSQDNHGNPCADTKGRLQIRNQGAGLFADKISSVVRGLCAGLKP